MKLLYAIGFIVVFTTVMNWRGKKVRATSWKGAVTGVRHQRTSVARDEDRRDDDWVTVDYRTDAGREDRFKMRMRVYRQYYAGLQAGERLVKTTGSYLPKRDLVTDSADQNS